MDSSQLKKQRPTDQVPEPIPDKNDGSPCASTPDSLFNAKLIQMSLEDRSNGLNEIHGIIDVANERPDMVKEKSQSMSRALLSAIASLSAEESSAYRDAIGMSQEYVDGLKIRFLRAEHGYDSEKAAHRMISFFDYKKKLFGKEKLVEEITLDDLDAEASEALRRGLFQALQQRDRAGRPIFYCEGLVNTLFPMQACFQVFFYIIMAGMQDEMSQLRGCVCVWNGIGVDCFLNRTGAYWALWTAMPIRHSAFHILADNKNLMEPGKRTLAKNLDSKSLCRFRYHYGSHTEGIYQLLTFGIPREAIPIMDDGTSDLSPHHKFLDILKSREEDAKRGPRERDGKGDGKPATSSHSTNNVVTDNEEEEIILIPSPMDVLLGRGRQPKSRPGALRMHHLLNVNMDAYEAATLAAEKTEIAKKIVKEMQVSGCRFLREVEEGGGYVEIDDSEARAKIAHRFRDLRRLNKKKNNHRGTSTQVKSGSGRMKKRGLNN